MAFEESVYHPYDFANRRHIGPSPAEIAEMLDAVGAESLDALIDDTVPRAIRQERPLEWGPALSEQGMLHRMRQVASKNRVADQFHRPRLSWHGYAAGHPAQHS